MTWPHLETTGYKIRLIFLCNSSISLKANSRPLGLRAGPSCCFRKGLDVVQKGLDNRCSLPFHILGGRGGFADLYRRPVEQAAVLQRPILKWGSAGMLGDDGLRLVRVRRELAFRGRGLPQLVENAVH